MDRPPRRNPSPKFRREIIVFLDVSEFLIAAAATEKEKSGPRPGKGIATLHLEFDRPARTRMSDCTLILHLFKLLCVSQTIEKILALHEPTCFSLRIRATEIKSALKSDDKDSKERDGSAGFHFNEFAARESQTSRIRKFSPREAH